MDFREDIQSTETEFRQVETTVCPYFNEELEKLNVPSESLTWLGTTRKGRMRAKQSLKRATKLAKHDS